MAGYVFDHWEVNGETFPENPISILVDRDIGITAVYKESVTPPPPPIPLKNIAIGLAVATAAVIGAGYALSKKKGD